LLGLLLIGVKLELRNARCTVWHQSAVDFSGPARMCCFVIIRKVDTAAGVIPSYGCTVQRHKS
jgi:hypothetical protein